VACAARPAISARAQIARSGALMLAPERPFCARGLSGGVDLGAAHDAEDGIALWLDQW